MFLQRGMVQGSIATPGAIIMVNPDLSPSIQNRLVTQLQINEVITGEEFDVRFAAAPEWPTAVRILRRRVMVLRDFRDLTNRTEMDLVLFVKSAMISVTKNCYGPPGQTYLLKNVYWGALCIYNQDIYRRCNKHGCNCGGYAPWWHGSCGSCGGPTYDGYTSGLGQGCDGYARSPIYPATYDPKFPAENHWYNQVNQGGGVFNSYGGCDAPGDLVLCSRYQCNSKGCVGTLDCRLVKDSKAVPIDVGSRGTPNSGGTPYR